MRFLKMMIASTFLVALVVACKKEDEIPPVVQNTSIQGNIDTVVFAPGESFQIEATITDETELSQYLVLIQSDFDRESTKANTAPFKTTLISSISGKTWSLQENFTLPDTVSSGYYFGIIRALDAFGNLSEHQQFHFEVNRSDQPLISMNLPATIAAGATIAFDGNLSTEQDATLDLVKISIRNEQNAPLYSRTFSSFSGINTWNPFADEGLSFDIPIDESGKIFFRIRVADTKGNNTIFETEISIV
jgi:hypothetical protein